MALVRDHWDIHVWTGNQPPLGATVWPYSTGIITGCPQSRFDTCRPSVNPRILLAGRGMLRTPQGIWHLDTGDMFCIWPHMPISYWTDPHDPWQFIWVHIEGADALAVAQMMGFDRDMVYRRPVHPEHIIHAFRALHHATAPEDRNEFHVLSLLYALIEACASDARRCPNTAPARDLAEEGRLVIETLLETGINVSDIASTLGVTRNTLFRAFRERYHKSPHAYLHEARLLKAQEMLLNTNASVTAIAQATGFTTVQYFMRVFRQFTGMTPTAWRVHARGVPSHHNPLK